MWHALKSRHGFFDCGRGLAVRYPNDISRFAALAETTHDAFSDLAATLNPGHMVTMVTPGPLDVPANWQIMETRLIDQMICLQYPAVEDTSLVELGFGDVSDMLGLVEATQAGPFLPATVTLGRYLGIRRPCGQLVAMAGERLQMRDYVEISAICTSPPFRRRGYAREIVSSLIQRIFAIGCTPFLHVETGGPCKALYEGMGFRVRRTMHLTMMEKRGRPPSLQSRPASRVSSVELPARDGPW